MSKHGPSADSKQLSQVQSLESIKLILSENFRSQRRLPHPEQTSNSRPSLGQRR